MSARDLIRRFVLFVAAVVTLASGCGEDGIRIGAKPFVEQEILAEVLQGLLEEQGIATRPTYRCDDTFDCQRALGSGHVDLMVEYTGTAFNLLGEVPPDEGQLERLDTLFEPLGVRWLSPLGFDNGYVWLVPSRRAETDGLRAMTDLAKVSSLRVAVPPEFLQRPRDGLAATAARYGMHLAAEPIVALDPAERLQAVVTGRADVVVAYETDPSAGELGLVPLADDLGFLPRYQATVVARSEALKRQPELGPALASLGGAIDAAQMRAMNQAVAVEGASRTATAHALLQARGIVDTTSERAANRTRLRIAVDDAVLRESFGPRVLMGARSVFVDRTARLETIRGKAADAVANGRARFGIVGVESFFVRDGAGRLTRRRDLQAVAALGQRVLHLLSRSDADPWAGTIGVVAARGQTTAAQAVLADRGMTATVFNDRAEAFSAVGTSIDALLIAAPLHDTAVAALLGDGGRLWEVLPADTRNAAQSLAATPFLRPARIAANRYPGQEAAIETLSVQVVLAAPSSSALPGHNAAGPAGAIPGGGPPSLEQVEALAKALGTTEAPDPSVISAYSLGAPQGERAEASVLDTVLNLFVLAFCGWLVVLVLGPVRE